MSERQDVMNAISHCGRGVCSGCPYRAKCQHMNLSPEAAAAALKLLDVVTCAECIHRLQCLISGEHDHGDDWFCADGERAGGEQISINI
ncbi:MAG: hypothetical protein IJ175_07860 [Clostridia bacterium]|nr:hypothetical protein [Clostridia bacterium]